MQTKGMKPQSAKWRVLRILYKLEEAFGSPITDSQLMTVTHDFYKDLDQARVYNALGNLRRGGWIDRVDTTCHRLTGKGNEMVESVFPDFMQEIDEMFKAVSEQQGTETVEEEIAEEPEPETGTTEDYDVKPDSPDCKAQIVYMLDALSDDPAKPMKFDEFSQLIEDHALLGNVRMPNNGLMKFYLAVAQSHKLIVKAAKRDEDERAKYYLTARGLYWLASMKGLSVNLAPKDVCMGDDKGERWHISIEIRASSQTTVNKVTEGLEKRGYRVMNSQRVGE